MIIRACERGWIGTGKRSGAGRKLSEREQSGERRRIERERRVVQPERSSEQTKLLLKFRSKVMLLKPRNALQSLFYFRSKINYQPEFKF